MPERIDAILQLLEEGRQAQARTNELLHTVIVDLAVMKRADEGNRGFIAEMRQGLAAHEERIRNVELTGARFAILEGQHVSHGQKHDSLEKRVGSLERGASATSVVTGGVREVWKMLASAIVGAVCAAASMALQAGT